jgi:protein TonB
MFNNLIESSSHANEFKRRGSFLLFTTATYVVLFVISGVASIYAYDAHLESQNTELEIISFVPEPPPEVPAEVVSDPIRPTAGNTTPDRPMRTDMVASASDPTHVPPVVGTRASDVPPWRPGAIISDRNADPPTLASTGRGVPGGTGNAAVVDLPDPPPPAINPTPVPPKILRISRVLNSEALYLPKPNYPPIARQIRLQGTVTVQVMIDEKGNVISAKALSGHQLLTHEAQRAALQARFSPTKIGDQPVKVSGVITYNFVMN